MKEITHDLGDDIISDPVITDAEVLFRFKASDMDKLEKYLKPKTNGANISPFSSRNLPRNKDYEIPGSELLPYKDIVEKIGRERIIELTHMTKEYLNSLVTKGNTWEDIKADMSMKGLSGKNYIHSIGRWGDYIEYLKRMVGMHGLQ